MRASERAGWVCSVTLAVIWLVAAAGSVSAAVPVERLAAPDSWWGWVAHVGAHVSWVHLAVNVGVLWLLGRPLLAVFGAWTVPALWAMSVVAVALFVAFDPNAAPVVGASAAGCAAAGFLLVGGFSFPLRREWWWAAALVVVATGVGPQASRGVHLAAAAVGAVVGAVWRWRVRRTALPVSCPAG